MTNSPHLTTSAQTATELQKRAELVDLLLSSPIDPSDLLAQLGLFFPRQNLSRVLYMYELYQKILPVHGYVLEFGVRWGQNMALFSNFRGMLEPFNHNRRIIGFDTFGGFPEIAAEDGKNKAAAIGGYGVSKNYEDYLSSILDFHESQSPIPHVKKYELVKGDATKEIRSFLERNPQTVVALAYFDFDIYLPTKACLEAIIPHLTKGSILAFDEVNSHEFPGETVAVREVLGTNKIRLMRSPLSPLTSYAVWEG